MSTKLTRLLRIINLIQSSPSPRIKSKELAEICETTVEYRNAMKESIESWLEIYKQISKEFEGVMFIMENIKRVFIESQFQVTRETVKSIEFEHVTNGKIVYLLPNQELTIVLHPKTVEKNHALHNLSFGFNHNSSFKNFPKRKNTGTELIHYGYSFKFQSTEELGRFLSSLIQT